MFKFGNARKGIFKKVFLTTAITAMIFGTFTNSVLAASGDYYDASNQIHYSTQILKNDVTSKTALKAAAKAQHVILVEIKTGVFLDYFKTNNKIAQLMLSGTDISQIYQLILQDDTLRSNVDVSNFEEPDPTVISISALESHLSI